MKKIIITRKNEYMSAAQTFGFYVNGVKHLLDTNSSITINTEDEAVQVYAKVLWMKTRVVTLNQSEKEFNINIKPFFDNKAVVVAILLFIASVFFMCGENDTLDLIGRIILISMMVIYVYSFTIGSRNYLKLEINKK